MTEFTVNPTRFDPYKNFKFRIKWDGKYIAGLSKMSALKRTTEVIKHREGGDPNTSRKSPGRTGTKQLLWSVGSPMIWNSKSGPTRYGTTGQTRIRNFT